MCDEDPTGSASLAGLLPRRRVLRLSPTATRTLRVDVSGLPAGGAVQVVRGVVDRAGTADPRPGTRVVATLGATGLAPGARRTGG